MSLRICFAAAEIAPLAKTGGLADVAAALPRYLHAQGHDVRLFMPMYSSIGLAGLGATHVAGVQDVTLELGSHRYSFSLLQANLPGSALPVLLVHCPAVFDRSSIYTDAGDEHLRFLVLQHAILQSCQRLGFAPHILHCNDWHSALLPLLLKSVYGWDRLFAHTRSVLTIHNIGYQGVFGAGTLNDLTAPGGALSADLVDLGNQQLNWLREGIRHADRVTTVSPTYAHEICTREGGHGLDGMLRRRGDDLIGILNGVDYEEWNPATDRYLKYPYGSDDLSGKAATKRWLLDWLNLPPPQPPSGHKPLVGVISRLTSQKGFDLLFDCLPELLAAGELYLVAVGSGEWRYEEFFGNLQRRFANRVVFHRGYHEELAHLIEAASDIFLMPSLYEPCGLNQMYSLKYGTVPVVRHTGGLADSVQMWDSTTRRGTGIVFNDFDTAAMRWALRTALDLYQDRAVWSQIMRNGMAQDFSWEQQGQQYVQLYRQLVEPLLEAD
jgi:starch synthase